MCKILNVKEKEMEIIKGSITAPQGFLATGAHIGIKKKKKDLTIIKSQIPAIASGCFTTNIVQAAPVLWCKEKVNNKITAIAINSGNANACTGEQGKKHNEIMAETLAGCLNCTKDEILVASTGIIGVPLPIEKIVAGIKAKAVNLENTEKAANEAAEGIMTTDTFTKEIAIKIELAGKVVKIGGIAKGSGMIHPNMATMLSFITTDTNISKDLLDKALKESITDSYNMISVDGDTSTNDMVVVLANGMAKNDEIKSENTDYQKFKEALHFVNTHLAKEIIRDGEGITKFLEVEVTKSPDKEVARKIAKSIVTSNLVKTAMFGEDANWGRILAAAGYSGAIFDPNKVSIEFQSKSGTVTTFLNGEPIKFSETMALKVLGEKEIKISVSLNQGTEQATAWGTDLSYEYVKINGEYRT